MTVLIKHQIEELSDAYQNFAACVGGLSPEQQSIPGVCGAWSAKDVIAHLVGWDVALTTFIKSPETFNPEPLYDVHAFNAKSVADRRALVWGEVATEQQAVFSSLINALEAVSPEMKIYPRVTGWLSGRIEDYRLHTGQLESWLKS